MIEVRGVSKRYGPTLAVDDLTFDVRPGVVTGFVGPNGAGKSTTMRMVLGLAAPTSGTVTVGGRRYADLPAPLREVGALLDAGAVHRSRRAVDHLRWLATSNGIPRRRVDEVLGLVGLGGVAHRRAGTFSLGMSQRLGIAAALLGDPPVLLFDEPVNGLDPEGIVWARGLMRRLESEGRTILVSSHLMNEMAVTADHLVVIGKGRLIADAGVEDVTRSAARGTVLVRAGRSEVLRRELLAVGAAVHPGPDGALLVEGMDSARIGETAAAAGIPLSELTPQRTSLEEAFMDLTRSSIEYGSTAGADW